MKYTVCISNYNSGATIEPALGSVLPQVSSEEFEVVVVDNESHDYSKTFLEEKVRTGAIQKLVVSKSSRGKARQLAMENSSAPYIIANIDMDVVYLPKVREALEMYHAKYEGKVLSVYGAMILPRSAAVELGGWRDLDRHEDNDLAARAFGKGLHAQDLSFNLVSEHLRSSRQSLYERILQSYVSYRDWFRIGLRVADLPKGRLSLFHPTIGMGYISSWFHKSFRVDGFSNYYRVWQSGGRHGNSSSDD